MLEAIASRLGFVPQPEITGAESVPRRRTIDWLEHHPAADHARLLVRWMRTNVDPSGGMVFREAMQEFYAEAVIEAGWAPRPWNPVARQLDLLCTGGAKPYCWVMSPTGRMKRRRYYPIPTAEAQLRAA
jgi:hypothetical protein